MGYLSFPLFSLPRKVSNRQRSDRLQLGMRILLTEKAPNARPILSAALIVEALGVAA